MENQCLKVMRYIDGQNDMPLPLQASPFVSMARKAGFWTPMFSMAAS